MKNDSINDSKLMVLLGYLNDKEFKELGLWVHSPIHNNSRNVLVLYDVIKKKYRKKDKEMDSLSMIKHLNLLPRTAKQKDICPRHKQELRRAMHLFSEQVENFLIWKQTQTETIMCKRKLMDALSARQAYELVPAVMNKTRKIHQASPLRDIKHYEMEYLLAETSLYMDIVLKNRDTADSMEKAVDTLRHYTLSQLLRYYCGMVNTGKVVKTENNDHFISMLTKYLENSEDLKIFAVRIYYLLLKVLKKEEIKDYYELKKLLFEQLHFFDAKELRELLNFLSNYCNRMIHKGNGQFVEEKFELYTVGLERECWTKGTAFSPHQFIQIISTALKLNKITWANDFIIKYGDKLSLELRNNMLNYGHALCAFEAGKYDLAHDFLSQINTIEDFIFRLRIKILLIKIYYDKNELTYKNIDTHPINNELETIKHFVLPSTNKKIAEVSRQRYGNFANFFKRILNRKKKIIDKIPPKVANIQALKTELADLQPLTERAWLTKKLDELIEEVGT